MKMIRKEIAASTPDANGNFVERMLYDMKENNSNPNSCLRGNDGPLHLAGTLLEIFMAGKYIDKIKKDFCH